MDPKRDRSWSMLAKGQNNTGSSGYSFPSAGSGPSSPSSPASPSNRSFPPIDDHLVKPEAAGDELIRGRAVVALPAYAPHADRQSALAGLMEWSIRSDYVSSVELLTRVSEGSDFATDVCIRKAGDDPATGERYLEEVSFEIVNEQSMRDIREKAEDLVTRGVRRVFAVFVKRKEIAEWSQAAGDFIKLDLDSKLEDPCLVHPILLRALLDRNVAESELVKALEERKSPSLEAMKDRVRQEGLEKGLERGLEKGLERGLEKGREIGREEGQRQALEQVLVARFGALSSAQKTRLATAKRELLSLWLERLFSVDNIDALFALVDA